MDVIEDLDGDGLPDVLVGAPRQDVNVGDEGGARVLSSASGCEPFHYCEAKLSGAGCLAAIGSLGSPSLSGPGDLRLTAHALPSGATGLFLLSHDPAASPLGWGVLCVLPPLERSLPLSAGGSAAQPCAGRFEIALPPADLLARGWQPGDLLHTQAWFRDPGHPDGTASSVSDALGVLLCP